MDHRTLYFKEIDSLRALSVLGVVLFHLDRAFLPGGYTGVDCFFVISGFVVTHSLLRFEPRSLLDLLRQFYARRLLRIVPALMVMLLVTALASALFIPDAWLSKRNKEIGSAAFFGVSNLFLAKPSNSYFGPIAEFNPFTHSWSLGIEEQFYLVAPLILYLARRRPASVMGLRTAMALTGLLSLASLIVCASWTPARPTYAFYLLPSRFWELGTGVLMALSQAHWKQLLASKRSAGAAIAVGAAALVGSMLYANAEAFPFPWALLSVVGTSLLIAGIAAHPDGILPWPLSTGAVQYVGRLSYSLYLWHWPVFVLFGWTVGLQSGPTGVIALATALLLAVLSYRFVEVPVRSARRFRTWPSGRTVVAGLAVVAVAGAAGSVVLKSEPRLTLSRVTQEERSTRLPALSGSAKCFSRVEEGALGDGYTHSFKPSNCQTPVSPHRLFVMGDSHALGYETLLERYSADTGHEVRVLFREGCSFIPLVRTQLEDARCQAFTRAILDYLAREVRPGDMMFLASLRLPRFADQWGSPDARRPVARSQTSEARVQLLVDEAAAQLEHFDGVTIVFEAPKPIFRSPPFRCADWFNAANPVCAGGFHLSREEFDTLRAPVLETMKRVSQRVPKVYIWDPAETLCDPAGCAAYANGQPLFFDGDHLSKTGNAAVYPPFASYVASVWP